MVVVLVLVVVGGKQGGIEEAQRVLCPSGVALPGNEPPHNAAVRVDGNI